MWIEFLFFLATAVSIAHGKRVTAQADRAPFEEEIVQRSKNIAPLTDIHVDSLDGNQLTFDLTPFLKTPDELNRDIYELLSPFDKRHAVGFAVIGGHAPKPGYPANALIQGAQPLTNGINHWRFVGLSGPYGCGFTDLKHFGSGWKLNGLFLTSNGNLAGRGALKVGFVKRMPEIPTVDWFFEMNENKLDVYIVIDDVPQGHAFSLTFPNSTAIADLRPAITFTHDTDDVYHVLVYQFKTLPLKPQYAQVYQIRTTTKLRYTSWYLQEDPTARLLITQGKVTLKVANIISCQADFLDDGRIEIHSGPISTRLMPPEDLRKLETSMTKMLTTLRAWNIDKTTLHIDSDIGVTTWLKDETQTPIYVNPFVTE